ncbi:MAG: YncE family protein [Bacteroidetes bacterium]|nr:YncE family protein [Bacteroidota bacterium]
MKKINLILSVLLIALSFGFTSCNGDDDDKDPITETNLDSGLFVLCEGNWNMNNAALSFYTTSKSKVTLDLFSDVNGQGLGDTGNDMISFGDNLYIAVKESASVVVVNRKTGKMVKRIPITNAQGVNRMPSRLCASSSMIYLSTFDGNLIEINPITNSVGRVASVGRNPEGVAFVNNKIYVANSGGMDFPNYDNSISIVDASTMSETQKLVVGLNPGVVKKLDDNTVGVYVKGNYGDVPSKFVTINANTDAIDKNIEISMMNFDVFGDKILYSNYLYSSGRTVLYKLDYKNNDTFGTMFFADGQPSASIVYPYGINVDYANNEVFITDAKDFAIRGEVFVYDLGGNLKYSFQANNIPSVVIPRR